MRAFGFELTVSAPQQLLSIDDYRRAAQRVLPRMVWSFVDGAADGMVSVGRNRSAFDRWTLRSRVLTGHDRHDLSATVGGMPLSLPVLLAPTGFAGLTNWRGDVAAARAAADAGSRYVVSTLSSWSIEEVAEASSAGHAFQLYPSRADVATQLMRRAWDAGMRTLVVTVDVPVKGNREGERRTGMGVPPTVGPRELVDMARHPGWTLDVLAHRRVSGRNLVARGGVAAAIESVDIQERQLSQATLNWDDVAWMRGQWKGELFIKGVLDPEDATRAVALGADGVIVSNHGGRQLDHAMATLDALPAVVAALGGRGQVLLDGGIRRGTDVIKALCLGADAVLIGRPYLYGLAVGGEAGVAAVLEILRAEVDRALTLMGVRDVRDLDRTWVIDRHSAGCPGGRGSLAAGCGLQGPCLPEAGDVRR